MKLFTHGKMAMIAMPILATISPAHATYEIKLSAQDTLTFGGFIKVDARYVDGNIAYNDFWLGSGNVLAEEQSKIKLFANETRFNMKFVHGEVTGFIEMDFYGGGGNEIISNSSHPRLRHAFIKYQDWLVGQTWTTFMNTSALAETADFAGPMVGEAFVRNTMIRFTHGNFSFAIENPETYGNDAIDSSPDADPANDNYPDLIAKYSLKGE